MSLILSKNVEVTRIRQFSSEQFMLDNFYKPIIHVTFTILLGIYAPELNTETEN